MYTFYYSPNSISLAVHIVLEELGVSYKPVLISSTNSEMTGKPDWRSKNPKGRVPALADVPGHIGGSANLLTETPAILWYLGTKYENGRLVPSPTDGQARCLEWMNWLSSDLHSVAFGQIWRPKRFTTQDDNLASIVGEGHENLSAAFGLIEVMFRDSRQWAVPAQYSIVDPYLFVFHRWGTRVGHEMTQYPAWGEWFKRMMEKQTVQKVIRVLKLPL